MTERLVTVSLLESGKRNTRVLLSIGDNRYELTLSWDYANLKSVLKNSEHFSVYKSRDYNEDIFFDGNSTVTIFSYPDGDKNMGPDTEETPVNLFIMIIEPDRCVKIGVDRKNDEFYTKVRYDNYVFDRFKSIHAKRIEENDKQCVLLELDGTPFKIVMKNDYSFVDELFIHTPKKDYPCLLYCTNYPNYHSMFLQGDTKVFVYDFTGVIIIERGDGSKHQINIDESARQS